MSEKYFTDVTARNLLETIKARIVFETAAEYSLGRDSLNLELIEHNYLSRKLAFVYCQYLHSDIMTHGQEKIFNSNISWKKIQNAIGFWEIPNFQKDIADLCQLKYFSFSDRMFVPIYWGGNFIRLDAYQCLAIGSIDPNGYLIDPDMRQDCIEDLGYKVFTDALIAVNLELPKLLVSFKDKD